MRKTKAVARFSKPTDSFTLVELLVVMAIIAILAALILAAGNGVVIKAMRSRTTTEIQAMGTAAEGYKADNGIYPQGDGNLLTNGSSAPTFYTADDGITTANGEYQTNSTLLYIALSGQTNFAAAPVSGAKHYMSFRQNQIGNPNGPYSYIKDPWSHSYGYSTGTPSTATTTNYPYAGSGFFDLWSTGGVTLAQLSAKPALTNAWICSWQ